MILPRSKRCGRENPNLIRHLDISVLFKGVKGVTDRLVARTNGRLEHLKYACSCLLISASMESSESFPSAAATIAVRIMRLFSTSGRVVENSTEESITAKISGSSKPLKATLPALSLVLSCSSLFAKKPGLNSVVFHFTPIEEWLRFSRAFLRTSHR